MAKTRIKAGVIAAGAITADKIAPGAITAEKIAEGVSLGSAAPTIATVSVTDSSWTVLDDTAVDIAGGYIKITGSEFQNGCVVMVGLESATSVTFTSATELRVQVPAQAAGTYPIYVINPDGITAAKLIGLTYSGMPTWVTGSTLPEAASDNAYTTTLSATGAVSYSLQSGSSLPTGFTLDSTTGVISGTTTVLSQTTYTFTILATDAENQDSPRTFSLTVVVATATVDISPALEGKTTWVFNDDGNTLTFPAGTIYTVTNTTPIPFNFTVKLWGAGGGAAGGFTTGTYTLTQGASIKCYAGSTGVSGYAGGGASAIYSADNEAVPYAVAGGGGGTGNTTGGLGGGETGEKSANHWYWAAEGGYGGTQSAGGAGGTGNRGNGFSGSFRNGGAGGSLTGYSHAGGTGWGSGGAGGYRQGDGFQGGGGGGYYGGGGGGASADGAGGGGGSGYIGGLTNAQTVQGAGSDSDRGTAGNAGDNGKIMMIFVP